MKKIHHQVYPSMSELQNKLNLYFETFRNSKNNQSKQQEEKPTSSTQTPTPKTHKKTLTICPNKINSTYHENLVKINRLKRPNSCKNSV